MDHLVLVYFIIYVICGRGITVGVRLCTWGLGVSQTRCGSNDRVQVLSLFYGYGDKPGSLCSNASCGTQLVSYHDGMHEDSNYKSCSGKPECMIQVNLANLGTKCGYYIMANFVIMRYSCIPGESFLNMNENRTRTGLPYVNLVHFPMSDDPGLVKMTCSVAGNSFGLEAVEIHNNSYFSQLKLWYQTQDEFLPYLSYSEVTINQLIHGTTTKAVIEYIHKRCCGQRTNTWIKINAEAGSTIDVSCEVTADFQNAGIFSDQPTENQASVTSLPVRPTPKATPITTSQVSTVSLTENSGVPPIVYVVIGGLLGLCVVLTLCVFFCWRRTRRESTKQQCWNNCSRGACHLHQKPAPGIKPSAATESDYLSPVHHADENITHIAGEANVYYTPATETDQLLAVPGLSPSNDTGDPIGHTSGQLSTPHCPNLSNSSGLLDTGHFESMVTDNSRQRFPIYETINP